MTTAQDVPLSLVQSLMPRKVQTFVGARRIGLPGSAQHAAPRLQLWPAMMRKKKLCSTALVNEKSNCSLLFAAVTIQTIHIPLAGYIGLIM